jgi:glycosyltransferase involved in cell wall biosynthesis
MIPSPSEKTGPWPSATTSALRDSTLISVITPTFNNAATLVRACRSVLDQRGVNLELIIVNDGSADTSGALADELVRADRRVRVVHQPNHGLSAARNAGIDAARGTHLAFLDADDVFRPGALRGMLDTCTAHPGDAAFAGFDLVDGHGRLIAAEQSPLDVLGLDELLAMHFVIVSAVMLPRTTLGADRFDPACRRAEDYDLWFRLALRGVRWRNARITACAYTVRPGSMSTDYEGMFAAGADLLTSAMTRAGRTEPQLREALAATAMNWATRAALTDSSDRGLALARSHPHDPRTSPIDPQRAAGHALAAVRLGLAQPVSLDSLGEPQPPAWLPRLVEWWETLERHGLARGSSPGVPFTHSALQALVERTLPHDQVARAIIARLPRTCRQVAIIGRRAYAAAVAKAGAQRGMSCVHTDSPNTSPHTPSTAGAPCARSPDDRCPIIITELAVSRSDLVADLKARGRIVLDWFEERRALTEPVARHLLGLATPPPAQPRDRIPLVSIIVPLFNSAETIAQTLDSALNQDGPPFEVVVVNDGSTDNGDAVARTRAARDDRVRVIDQPNSGLSAARNTGIHHSRGEWLLFLDADDWLLPGALRTLTDRASSARASAACGAVVIADRFGHPLTTHIPGAEAIGLDDLLDRTFLSPHAHIIHRDALGQERFDTSLRVVEDLDLWLRLAARGLVWVCTPDPVARYRVRPGSLSKNGPLMFETTRLVRGRAFERLASAANPAARSTILDRRDRAVRADALALATRTALLSAGAPDDAQSLALRRARDILRDAGVKHVEPRAAGHAAAGGLIYAVGIRPLARDLGRAARHLSEQEGHCCDALEPILPLLRGPGGTPGLWTTLAGADTDTTPQGHDAHDQVNLYFREALCALACALVAREEVTAEIVRSVTEHHAAEVVTLAGLGRNGALLAPELLRAGVDLRVRDDRLAGTRWIHLCGQSVPIEPMDAPLPPDRLLIITPDDPRPLAARCAGHGRTLRWSDVQARLAGLAAPDRVLDASDAPTHATIAGTNRS